VSVGNAIYSDFVKNITIVGFHVFPGSADALVG